MSIGKDSVKRAAATKKTAKHAEKKAETTIAEVAVADISYRSGKACPALAESIKGNGVILPVILVKDGESLKVVDGAKRLNALKELGVTSVKAVILGDDAKKVKAELKKCGRAADCATECSGKPAVKSVEKAVGTQSATDVKEEKFNLVKRLDEDDFPVYLL
mgnify:CR=1 FL=1